VFSVLQAGELQKGAAAHFCGKSFYACRHMTETAVVVQKAYDWNLWILPKVEKFPKSYRFSLGQNLVETSMDLLMHLVDATYQTRNSSALAAAVGKVNRARYLVRMAKDLHMLNLSGYEFASKNLDEIGRMSGGWWKSVRQKDEAGR
jgi:hypothetical protein